MTISPTGSPREEIAVIGLGASGRATATLLARDGERVYASDAGATDALRATAQALGALGVVAEAGRHDLPRIARARLVVASPGVPPSAPPIQAAAASGVRVVSEIEVALAHLPGLRYVAVTGTNGKTTTTALIAHLFRALGYDAVAAGNIGLPLADVALRDTPPDWVALELSSFQLHDTPSIDPTVGVLTNLSPDHLDRYATVDDYYADKQRLFANARSDSRFVINADDSAVMAMGGHETGLHWHFSTAGQHAEGRFVRRANRLDLLGRPLIDRTELHLLGDHNVANALAAALAVGMADERHTSLDARARVAGALREFQALPHRLQVIGELGGVQWIDDSKATNVSSTLVALESMTRSTVLLLGGRHKGEPYLALARPLARVGKAVLAYGEAAPLIERDLAGVLPVERLGSQFDAVVERARALAAPGDAVLLSPGCSSFDMFRDYAERGDTFARLAGQAGAGDRREGAGRADQR